MFALDPAHAVAEIRRILRPGGRVALAVWGPRARNPWLSLVFDAVSAQLGTTLPPPGVPGPFALDDPERLAGLLAGAGLPTWPSPRLPGRGPDAPSSLAGQDVGARPGRWPGGCPLCRAARRQLRARL